VNVSSKQTGSEYVISLAGRFDFNAHREFRNAYESALAAGNVKTITINLERADYLDSSALGMLLLLKEKAQAANIEIVVSACPSNIRKILEVANFGKLFKIL
jgi:anti-anti-sigma factor